MRLVLIGGSGFVGSNLVQAWVSGDFLNAVFDSILIIDNGSSGGHSRVEKHLSSRIRLLDMDAANAAELANELRREDFVIFLAANPDISKGYTEPRLDFQSGTVTAEAVAEACRLCGVGYLFFSSGSGVYGDNSAGHLDEESVTTLVVSPYAASKVAAEALFSAYANMFGMQVGVARFANLVGPNQTHGVVFDFVRKLRAFPGTLQVLGDGHQTKSYLHVSDALRAVELICNSMLTEPIQSSTRFFNVSNVDVISVREIAEIVLEVGDLKEASLAYTGGRAGWPGDVPRVHLSSSRIETTLGWRPRFSSAVAIRMSAHDEWADT